MIQTFFVGDKAWYFLYIPRSKWQSSLLKLILEVLFLLAWHYTLQDYFWKWYGEEGGTQEAAVMSVGGIWYEASWNMGGQSLASAVWQSPNLSVTAWDAATQAAWHCDAFPLVLDFTLCDFLTFFVGEELVEGLLLQGCSGSWSNFKDFISRGCTYGGLMKCFR
jgi:hypothetical protein